MKYTNIGNGNRVKRNSTSSHYRINQKKNQLETQKNKIQKS
jgi:hypothetical protein